MTSAGDFATVSTMRPVISRAAALGTWGLLTTGLSGAVAHAAGDLDPDLPHAVFVGRAPAAQPAVPKRVPRSVTRATLPADPKPLWRRELEVGVDVPPAVTADGGLVLALSSGEVLRLDPEGKELWRRALAASAPSTGPVLTSDGGVVLLTGEGGLWKLTAGGAIASRRQLGWEDANDVVPPLARDDGSVVLAGSSAAMIMDSRGRMTARTALREPPTGHLLSWRGGVLWTTRSGRVTWWRSPQRPQVLGSMEGPIFDGGPVLVSDRTLVAVVYRSTVVAFDLLGRRSTLLFDVQRPSQLDGTPTLAGDTLLLTTMPGVLVGLDPLGLEVRRQALDPAAALVTAPPTPGTPPVFRRFDRAPSPPLLADEAGRIVFLRGDGRLGVVMPKQEPRTVERSVCARPIAMQPAGKGRLVITCRLGTVIMLGNERKSAAPVPAAPSAAPAPSSGSPGAPGGEP